MEYNEESKKARTQEIGDKGLKSNAIGFVNALAVGLGANAPGYSLAATLGTLAVVTGLQAPAIVLAAFVPMLFIATAFYYMNRADQDCGTTFSWVTRAMGPWLGWMGGWAICASCVLVIGSLADVAARYGFLLFGFEDLATSKVAVTILAVLIIVVMTTICSRGVELSANVQNVMIISQVAALLLFAVVALVRVFGGSAPQGFVKPEVSWFSPFAVADGSTLVAGLLIGVFIYWGWEASVNVTEETENSVYAPGRAAVLSTAILLATYLSVVVSVLAFAGLGIVTEFADDDAILSAVATDVLGSPLDKLVVLAVFTAALGATQGVLFPVSRVVLSMSRAGAAPALLGEVHANFRTPVVATVVMGFLGVVWYVPINFLSANFLFDTISGLSLLVAFYYSLTGFACVIYYRRELLKSMKNLLFMGVAPLIGATFLTYVFFRSLIDLSDPDASYTGSSVLGLGLPLVIGLGCLLLGVVLMVSWRLSSGRTRFFDRRPETARPGAVAAEAVVLEKASTSSGKGR